MSDICHKCGHVLDTHVQSCSKCGTIRSGALLDATRVATPTLLAQHRRPVTSTSPDEFAAPVHGMNRLTRTARVPDGQRECLMLAIDVSGSMADGFSDGTSKLHAAVRAGANLVIHKCRIDPLDEVGLLSFTDRSQLHCLPRPCGAHKNGIIQSLQRLTAGGGTDITQGLRTAGEAMNWSGCGITRRVVLLTDGQGGEPLRTAESLKAKGAVLDIIGVGASPEQVNERLLRAIASTVAGELRYRFIKDQQALVTHYTALANKTQTATS